MEYPKNWQLKTLEDVLEVITNGSNLEQFEEQFEGSSPISRIETIANETIDFERVKYVNASKSELEKYSLHFGDILFSHINSDKHLGKTAIYTEDRTLVHGINLLLIRTNKNCNSFFLNYLFKYYRATGVFMGLAQRAVNQSSINQKKLKSLVVLLPPLSEQQRLVAKLDALFGSLEQLKSRLNTIPQLLKTFRQAVLTQAVTGKLTREWREGKVVEEWESKTIEEISDYLSGFAFKSEDFVDKGIQLIRMGNLYNNKLDLSRNPVYLPADYNKEIVRKYTVSNGDVLLSLTGTKYKRDYGFAIKVSCDTQLLLNQRVMALRPKIDIDFFLYLLRDDTFRNQFFSFETGGVNQGNVGTKAVLSIVVPVPPLPEQHEIVRRVEGLLSKADAIEARYRALKAQVDALPQAVLGKAFRGELR